MIKTKQGNDMIDHTSVVYAKNKIELSWQIKLKAHCDENQIAQLTKWS